MTDWATVSITRPVTIAAFVAAAPAGTAGRDCAGAARGLGGVVVPGAAAGRGSEARATAAGGRPCPGALRPATFGVTPAGGADGADADGVDDAGDALDRADGSVEVSSSVDAASGVFVAALRARV